MNDYYNYIITLDKITKLMLIYFYYKCFNKDIINIVSEKELEFIQKTELHKY